jgi:L-threonine-O-3-phosphate decarboxylase
MIPARPEVLAMTEAVHGAVNRTELDSLGIVPATVLDFSASINPFGPSPRVFEVLSKSPIDNYPDRDAIEFRQAAAEHLAIPANCLIAGNGSSELLLLIALAYFRPRDTVLIVGPTYSEYARVSQIMGATVTHRTAMSESSFEFPTEAVADSLRTQRPRAMFLCNPNNPTGRSICTDSLRQWLDEFSQTLFIVDEAYIEFAVNATSISTLVRENLIVLRSMTKAHGLAGLRLGYAVSHPGVIENLCRVRPPWSVNALAQATGIAALNDPEHLKRSVAKLLSEKQRLVDAFRANGWTVYPSDAHFFLIHVANASHIRRQLLESGILVRDCASFQLPNFLRISPRSFMENAILLDALNGLLKSAG